jgi:hypothetical protein
MVYTGVWPWQQRSPQLYRGVPQERGSMKLDTAVTSAVPLGSTAGVSPKYETYLEFLNTAFSKLYNPPKNLVTEEVTVVFKGRVVFRQYIPKRHRRFGIKIYNLWDCTGYTCGMKVYKQRKAQDLTATYATAKELTRKVEGRSHKLYMGNFFSSPDLSDDTTKTKTVAGL